MKDIVSWLKDAITTKKLVEAMAYYRASDGFIKATDGRITAAHPCDPGYHFLIPGNEFEKVISKFGDNLTVETTADDVTFKSGRSRATIKTLPVDNWDYPGVEDEEWMPIPKGLVPALRRLYPFVSDNATHVWAMGVTLERGWAFATNNIALAGIQLPQLGSVTAIVPMWAIEFLMNREEGLTHWCWTENYVAFQWSSGAWMRSTLMDDFFPEQVSQMIMQAVNEMPEVAIDKEFREAYNRVSGVSDGAIVISGESMVAEFGKGTMVEEYEIPELAGMSTIWAAKFLDAVIQEASYWEPQRWPRPAPFQGEGIFGFIVGRAR